MILTSTAWTSLPVECQASLRSRQRLNRISTRIRQPDDCIWSLVLHHTRSLRRREWYNPRKCHFSRALTARAIRSGLSSGRLDGRLGVLGSTHIYPVSRCDARRWTVRSAARPLSAGDSVANLEPGERLSSSLRFAPAEDHYARRVGPPVAVQLHHKRSSRSKR